MVRRQDCRAESSSDTPSRAGEASDSSAVYPLASKYAVSSATSESPFCHPNLPQLLPTRFLAVCFHGVVTFYNAVPRF